MSLQLEEHTIAGGGGVTVQVHGEVDSSTTAVAATLGRSSSTSVSRSAACRRQARTTGGRVALCVGAGSAVERLLSLTGFDRVVPVVSSLDAAYETIRIDKPDLAAGGDA